MHDDETGPTYGGPSRALMSCRLSSSPAYLPGRRPLPPRLPFLRPLCRRPHAYRPASGIEGGEVLATCTATAKGDLAVRTWHKVRRSIHRARSDDCHVRENLAAWPSSLSSLLPLLPLSSLFFLSLSLLFPLFSCCVPSLLSSPCSLRSRCPLRSAACSSSSSSSSSSLPFSPRLNPSSSSSP